MAGRPHGPVRTEREETASPALSRLVFIAIGVAMLIGFTCGLLWTAYHLLKGYVGG